VAPKVRSRQQRVFPELPRLSASMVVCVNLVRQPGLPLSQQARLSLSGT
jgi:hypothetical protein